MKIRAFVCASALLAAVGFTSAPAVTPAAATLTPTNKLVTWTGQFHGKNVITLVPAVVCARGACDDFSLHIALGPGYWAANPGGVEVALRWPYDGITDIDLLVYGPNGKEVARSTGLDSNAESLLIPHPNDGTYRVTAVPTNTLNPDTFGAKVHYEGLAQIEPAPSTGPVHDLLPNLVVFPPDGFHIASALNLIPFPENPVTPCYPEETIQKKDHPTRCLRFNQTIANVGEGRLELRFDMRGIPTPSKDDDQMIQRIFRSDGTYWERLADRYKFHAVHAHIHYQNFGRSFLYNFAWGTGRIGAPLRRGNKVGFCVTDVFLLDSYWGATGNGQRLSQTFPGCNIPKEITPGGPIMMVQGIDVGWADVYGWNLADQYINITGVSDGLYELEQLANPSQSVIESDYTDDSASAVICLKGDAVTPVATAAQAAACVA